MWVALLQLFAVVPTISHRLQYNCIVNVGKTPLAEVNTTKLKMSHVLRIVLGYCK